MFREMCSPNFDDANIPVNLSVDFRLIEFSNFESYYRPSSLAIVSHLNNVGLETSQIIGPTLVTVRQSKSYELRQRKVYTA